MAPVLASRRPPLPRLISLLFAVALLLCVFCQDVSPLIVYNRQALFEIKALSESLLLSRSRLGQQRTSLPPVLAEVPAHLLHYPCAHPRKRRFRKRGKRGGVIVKLKAYLAFSSGGPDAHLIHDGRYFPAVKRALHMRGCWIRSILPEPLTTLIAGFPTFPNLSPVPLKFPGTPSNLAVEVPRRCCQFRGRRRGVTPELLRPLKRAVSPATEELELRIALLNARSLVNKTFLLNDFFTSRDLDFMLLTETWLRDGEYTPLSELLPPGCLFLSSPRSTGRGGGLASVFKSSFQCRLIPSATYSSFELQTFELQLSSFSVMFAVVYRPPKFNKDFICDFADFLSSASVKYDHFLISGDFNIHVCCRSRPLVTDFLNLIESFNLVQCVKDPTHEKGHILDLVLSYDLSVSVIEICESACISDHLPVLFTVSIPSLRENTCASTRRLRTINAQTASQFSAMYNDYIFSSDVLSTLDDNHAFKTEDLLSHFNFTCADILDSVAPFRTMRIKARTEPWLNDSTRALRRSCRRAERKWKKDKLHVFKEALQESLSVYQSAVKAAKMEYFSSLVSCNSHKPQVLFNIFNSLVNPCDNSPVVPSLFLCESFLKFFIEKISALRPSALSSVGPSSDLTVPPSHAVFDQFEPVSLPSLANVVQHLRPTNCSSDSIPSRLFKEVFSTVGSDILLFINSCLSTGCVPAALKHAVVQPLIKKKNLDPSVLSNFRPISKLPFLSKILEKVVFIQIQSFLVANDIYEKFQSGFKPLHSTETALLRVFNDLMVTIDSGNPAMLVLLDLTAAFDTVDHGILLTRLEQWVGITGSALSWFQSYLTDRSFSVQLGEFTSPSAPLTSGVPQGSILGPILFLLYMLPLGSIFKKYNLSFHCYADDVQIYLPLTSKSSDSVQTLLDCLNDVKSWMTSNFLNLNEKKTEIIMFGCGPADFPAGFLGPLTPNIRSSVKNLGVIFDDRLKFDRQVSSVVKNSFYHLRILSKVKGYLPQRDLETVIHAFINSRLDYCNSLYFGLDHSLLHRLQLVQNAAARLLTGKRKRDHISPVLASLHWLPVAFRIDFKILLFVFKALNGRAPQYLTELLRIHTPARALRSANQLLLVTPKTKLKTKGDRAFVAAGPRLWNNLPWHIRSAGSFEVFKSSLKTHLFSLAFNQT